MIKLNIFNDSFKHQTHSVAGKTSKIIEWVRDGSGDNRVQFYVDEHCYREVYKDRLNIAWLLESPAIIPQIYNNFLSVANKFDIILTSHSELLKLPNAIFSASGGIWVGGTLGGGEIKIYEKGGTAGLISMVSSEKLMCPLHKFRYDIAKKFDSINDSYSSNPAEATRSKVDIFGLGEWYPIIDSLERYRFSIVIENFKDKTYFTEKILNCFATGTIPIYYGAEDINLYFNPDGIIRFSSEKELEYVISKLSIESYNSRKSAILENFQKCKEYEVIEDRFLRILDMRGDI